MNGAVGQPRPSSEQVRDLHVYVIPPELWRQQLRSAANEVITDSISLGFVRISPHSYLQELRHEIVDQLGDEYLPKDYAFLKSVGRCLTQVKTRQERELKAKHFLPPYAYAPELFILDAHAEHMRDSPSTIFHQSTTSGTSTIPRTGSKSNSGQGYYNGEQPSSYKYPSSHQGVTSPGQHRQPGRDRPADNNQYGSQIFDQQTGQPVTKSSYPTYSQPYSHDISALTNAHRNNVDNSHDYDRPPRGGGGGETYRKYNDDSSGYKSMSSPRKLSESPPRVKGGERKRDPVSSRYDDSTTFHISDRIPENNHHSPRRDERHDGEIIGDDPQSSNNDPNYNRNYHSPDGKRGQIPSTEHSPERDLGRETNVSSKLRNSRLGNDGPLDNSYDYGRESEDREMMSATPNTSIAKAIDQGAGSPTKTGREQSQYILQKSRSADKSANSSRDGSANTDKDSKEKRGLLKQLKQVRDDRLLSEKRREDLVKRARAMQAKTNNRRNQAREVWKKKYYEAKKLTPSLETECQKVRTELNAIHKKYLLALENNKVDGKQKGNHQLDAAKLQYEVDELQRRADAAKMKLTAEMKLRNQAETELRALRAELTQKKMNMNLSRAQKMNSLGNSAIPVS